MPVDPIETGTEREGSVESRGKKRGKVRVG